MSDEPTPPPPALRLKPRLRPAEVAPAPVPAPAVESSAPVPPPPAEPEVPAAPAQEPQRFKLKPKAPALVESPADPVPPAAPAVPAPPPPPLFIVDPAPTVAPTPATVPPVSPAAPAAPTTSQGTMGGFIPEPVRGPKQGVYVTGNAVKKTLPPFPTITPDGKDKEVRSNVPHLASGDDVADLDPALVLPSHAKRPMSRSFLIVIGVLILAATSFAGWIYFQSRKAAKPAVPVASPAKAPAKAPVPENPPALTPSETLNKIAQAPANAISKAQDAIAARRAGEQARVDAVAAGEEVPSTAAPKADAPKAAPTMTKVAPGLAATAPIDAEGESSRAFRLFVANARISGVFQGNPARAMINGKLIRAGERIDADLGIVFEGLSPDRHQLVFSDRSGAKVYRGY